ncbi:MAG: type III secretion system export apparatus subunit SctR [Gammaproteobacteria bacterium]
MTEMPDPFVLIASLALLSLAPFIGIMVTSFVKIVVVMFLIRNALGIQQIPPNMAVNGLAIILSIYIMAPVGFATYDLVKQNPMNLNNSAEIKTTLVNSAEPMRQFLLKHANERERQFFVESAATLWPAAQQQYVAADSLLVLLPAFTVSELNRAFEIGFLLYLPFVAIDLIVSNILLAMGMMMVSPMTISLPFKLLLFVLLDGWTRLIHGLVLSYQ